MNRNMKRLCAVLSCILIVMLLIPSTATVFAADAMVPMNPGFIGEAADPDNDPGTLTYKVSADGKEVTISYVVGGETRTYTVPNQNNYTSGALYGVDDLDRPMYTSEDVGVIGSTGEHYVGLFYFLWQGTNINNNYPVYDMQKAYEQHPEIAGDATAAVSAGLYGRDNSEMNWFAEPLYGYYYGNDEWVQRKHIELLMNAGVDFIYFDVTNGLSYWQRALKIMEICHEFNEQGFNAPKVVFYTHSNSSAVVAELYNNIYGQNLYPDTWFMIQGKPCIVAYPGDNINNFFYTKMPQWPIEPEVSGGNGWPWIDFDWPQHIYAGSEVINGKNVARNAINVSVAQHCGNIVFSTSALYGYTKNRGRSFFCTNGTRSYFGSSAGDFAYQNALLESYNRARADDQQSNRGLNFQNQFDYAYENLDDVTYILVTGWNEWVAQRQTWVDTDLSDITSRGINPSVLFVDTYNVEYSRDAEMTRGDYFDNYYMQLAYNIQKLRGTAPVIVQDRRQSVDVAGSFSQWDSVQVTYHDVTGDTMNRNAAGQGHVYTNYTGRNDIVAAKVTADTHNVYFYVETAAPITSYTSGGSWMQLMLNTDNEKTGWYGYDYIVNYSPVSDKKTTLARYNGQNNQFSFTSAGEIDYQCKGKQMMIAVPLSMLNITGIEYRELYMQFKWVDSSKQIQTMEDCYENGDCAPLGRMNYVFQNYIPGIPTYSARPQIAEPTAEYTTFDDGKIGSVSCQIEATANVKTIRAGGVVTICVGRDKNADVDSFVIVNETTGQALTPIRTRDIPISERQPDIQFTYIYIQTTEADKGSVTFAVYAKYKTGALSADKAQCTITVN